MEQLTNALLLDQLYHLAHSLHSLDNTTRTIVQTKQRQPQPAVSASSNAHSTFYVSLHKLLSSFRTQCDEFLLQSYFPSSTVTASSAPLSTHWRQFASHQQFMHTILTQTTEELNRQLIGLTTIRSCLQVQLQQMKNIANNNNLAKLTSIQSDLTRIDQECIILQEKLEKLNRWQDENEEQVKEEDAEEVEEDHLRHLHHKSFELDHHPASSHSQLDSPITSTHVSTSSSEIVRALTSPQQQQQQKQQSQQDHATPAPVREQQHHRVQQQQQSQSEEAEEEVFTFDNFILTPSPTSPKRANHAQRQNNYANLPPMQQLSFFSPIAEIVERSNRASPVVAVTYDDDDGESENDVSISTAVDSLGISPLKLEQPAMNHFPHLQQSQYETIQGGVLEFPNPAVALFAELDSSVMSHTEDDDDTELEEDDMSSLSSHQQQEQQQPQPSQQQSRLFSSSSDNNVNPLDWLYEKINNSISSQQQYYTTTSEEEVLNIASATTKNETISTAEPNMLEIVITPPEKESPPNPESQPSSKSSRRSFPPVARDDDPITPAPLKRSSTFDQLISPTSGFSSPATPIYQQLQQQIDIHTPFTALPPSFAHHDTRTASPTPSELSLLLRAQQAKVERMKWIKKMQEENRDEEKLYDDDGEDDEQEQHIHDELDVTHIFVPSTSTTPTKKQKVLRPSVAQMMENRKNTTDTSTAVSPENQQYRQLVMNLQSIAMQVTSPPPANPVASAAILSLPPRSTAQELLRRVQALNIESASLSKQHTSSSSTSSSSLIVDLLPTVRPTQAAQIKREWFELLDIQDPSLRQPMQDVSNVSSTSTPMLPSSPETTAEENEKNDESQDENDVPLSDYHRHAISSSPIRYSVFTPLSSSNANKTTKSITTAKSEKPNLNTRAVSMSTEVQKSTAWSITTHDATAKQTPRNAILRRINQRKSAESKPTRC